VPPPVDAPPAGAPPLLPPPLVPSPIVGPSLGPPPLTPGERVVAEVVFLGNRPVNEREVRSKINTRAGRPFDPAVAQKDVRALVETRKFFDVRVKTQPGPAPGTVVVIFE